MCFVKLEVDYIIYKTTNLLNGKYYIGKDNFDFTILLKSFSFKIFKFH